MRPLKGKEKGATTFIAVRVPPWIKEGVEQIAKQRGGPYSDVVIEILSKALARQGIRPPKR